MVFRPLTVRVAELWNWTRPNAFFYKYSPMLPEKHNFLKRFLRICTQRETLCVIYYLLTSTAGAHKAAPARLASATGLVAEETQL